MIDHKIYARHNGVKPIDKLPIPLLKHCIRTALNQEDVDKPCEVSILITNDSHIGRINSEYRGIDSPTDVLSFPAQDFPSPGWKSVADISVDPETGLVPLGDIVLSAERIGIQASELGHSRAREAAYLTVHSVLHLLGYDHSDEADDKKRMRRREIEIMGTIM